LSAKLFNGLHLHTKTGKIASDKPKKIEIVGGNEKCATCRRFLSRALHLHTMQIAKAIPTHRKKEGGRGGACRCLLSSKF